MQRTVGQPRVNAAEVRSNSFTGDEILANRDVAKELGYYRNEEAFYEGFFAKLKIKGGEKMVNTRKQSHYMKRSIFNTAVIAVTPTINATNIVFTYSAASVTGVLARTDNPATTATSSVTSFAQPKDIITVAQSPLRGRIISKTNSGVTSTITVEPQVGTTPTQLAAVFASGRTFSVFGTTVAEGDEFLDGSFQLFDRLDLVFQKTEAATPRMTNEYLGSGWRIMVNGSEYPLNMQMADSHIEMEVKTGISIIYGGGVGFGSAGTTPETMGAHTLFKTFALVVNWNTGVAGFDATDELAINNYMEANQMGSSGDFHMARNLAASVQAYLESKGVNNFMYTSPIDASDRKYNAQFTGYRSNLNKAWNFYTLPEATNPFITDMGQLTTAAGAYYSGTGLFLPTDGTGNMAPNEEIGTYGQSNTQPMDYEVLVFGQVQNIRGQMSRSMIAEAYQEPNNLNAWKHKYICAKEYAWRCRAINKGIALEP